MIPATSGLAVGGPKSMMALAEVTRPPTSCSSQAGSVSCGLLRMTVPTEVKKPADDETSVELGLVAALDQHGVDSPHLFEGGLAAQLSVKGLFDLVGLGDPGRRSAEDDLVPIGDPVDQSGAPVTDEDGDPVEEVKNRRTGIGGVISGRSVLNREDLPKGAVGKSGDNQDDPYRGDDDADCVPNWMGSFSC